MHWLRSVSVLTAVLLVTAGCAGDPDASGSGAGDDAPAGPGPERLRVEVIERYPHDREAFTQGLEMRDGVLYESTGLHGRSDVRTVDLQTGESTRQVNLDDEFFAEGLTVVGDLVWQLTWQENTAFARDRDTLAEQQRVQYEGEGWGLCYDAPGDRLVMSDGTARLTFRDPVSFEATGSVEVTREGAPQTMVNELECVDDRVWANIWQTDEIVRIDPATGEVDAVVDAAGLLSDEERPGADVLNGIAAIPDSDRFLITGKLWPVLFEVRFVPAE